MTLDDLTPDDNDEPKTHQVGAEYPVEYTGCFITPLFEVRAGVPNEYIEEYGNFRNAWVAWVEDEQPLMGPEQFKEYVSEMGKQVFSGEPQFRVQAVVKSTAIPEEHTEDREDVEYGFTYIVAFYYNDTHYSDGDQTFRRTESLIESDLERWEEQASQMFEGTPYSVTRYTLIPYEAGTKPLDTKHERY